MDNPLLMRLNNILRQQKPLGNILADLASHIVALHAVDRRIFIGVFLLYFLIITFNQAKDLLIRRIGFAHQCTFIAISNIVSGNVKCTLVHNLIFYKILDFLYIQRTPHLLADFSHIV